MNDFGGCLLDYWSTLFMGYCGKMVTIKDSSIIDKHKTSILISQNNNPYFKHIHPHRFQSTPQMTPCSRQEQKIIIEGQLLIIINISQKMSSKKQAQPSRDFSRDTQESFNKKMDQNYDERVRILQDNLVFVTALPHQIADKDKLTSDLYFGRYGHVSKLIINPSFPAKKPAMYQAYVTYSNELDASLAIVALDGYKLSDRPLKVSFGTTKYCSHFLRGNECSNIECFYLHKIDRKKEVSSGDTRTIFKEQNIKAMDSVLDHLQEVAVRVLESDVQEIQEGFPSLSEMLDYIVDNDYATAQQIDAAFQKANRGKKTLQVPKQQIRVQSMVESTEKSKQKQPPKLVKSNSHSTMSTPTKMIHEIDTITKKKQQSKVQKKVQVKTQLKQKQLAGKQNPVGIRQLKLEQKIQKLIIKELLKKSNNDCTSRFVKGVVASNEECLRLKGIVQKCLITHN